MYKSWWLIFLRLYELCSRQAKKYLYQPRLIYKKTTSILMIVEHAEISYDVDDDMSWFTGLANLS